MEKDRLDPSDSASTTERHNDQQNNRSQGETGPKKSTPLPRVTFSTFVLSLNTSALLHLGEIPDPVSGKKDKDIPLAKHVIDTLIMLRDKTTGNLEDDEKRLLESILFDLQLRFVNASRQ
ncbi:MAG: DUF1844 domain-containing protein [Dissulfurimicrobium sp.]|uniref:DUF1844 domain-containing protein n=1 Tax=Dissulfurimicrobium TaxID=1769732 RepID=UPI001EDAA340|nr:DUF1844 domain-containing protein [Dissulfurimicrobium hydrothermale]UKL14438.1 DUF1844 domain-containing protein [Dissulfurimicrobium hydrothermale]